MENLQRKHVMKKRARRARAHRRVRSRVSGSPEKPRLCVYKSLRYIYAQVIDDREGVTLTQASSLEKDVRGSIEGSAATRAAARAVGQKLAERALDKGIQQVVFDRGGFRYHGRVQELAEGAREKGLKL